MIKACLRDQFEIVKTLVVEGAAVNTLNIYGSSPLITTVERNSKNVSSTMRMLIFAGAIVDLENKSKQTALSIAIKEGLQEEVLKAVTDREVYESRRNEVTFVLKECISLPTDLITLIKDYEEIDEEFAFLKERERNIKKRLGKQA